jgi:hypothetical protein
VFHCVDAILVAWMHFCLFGCSFKTFRSVANTMRLCPIKILVICMYFCMHSYPVIFDLDAIIL